MLRKFLFTFIAVLTLTAGMGLTASAQETADTFDYKAYADTYPDLKAVYGYDANALFAHYINFGKAEGRVGSFAGNAAIPNTNATVNPSLGNISVGSFQAGGDIYTLPVPMSAFLNNGWKLDKSRSATNATYSGASSCWLIKGNDVLQVDSSAPVPNTVVPITQSQVYQISVRPGECPSLVLPYNITMNSTKADVEAKLPGTFTKEEYSSSIYSVIDLGRYINENLTTYSNYKSVDSGAQDHNMSLTFAERLGTIRMANVNWVDRNFDQNSTT
ncbi:MAG: hypothetical protein E7417_06885 [Ruminococcaceae bacterium]|nr:hypothetical protein [Oscillospiraceae bacterium]